jgi:hypothetical protein
MTDPIHSKLYTAEAAKSKKKVVEELKVPDPTLEEAKAILEQEDKDSADSEGND